MKLLLESDDKIIDLAGIEAQGFGVQARSGLSGLGLPPVSVQWIELSEGAKYRRTRVQSRNFDMPLDIKGRSRDELKQLMSDLALVLADECTLRMIDAENNQWTTRVVRTGGGDYAYGSDTTGNLDAQIVLTLRAGDPFWTSDTVSSKQIGGDGATSAFLVGMSAMPVASSQAIGTITLENIGDAKAYPVWEVYGPGNTFTAVSPATGETITWEGSLTAGQKLIVDTRTGSVTDGTGTNRYAELAAAPRFWSIPPGTTTAVCSLLDTTSASKIVCSWRPRKWLVI